VIHFDLPKAVRDVTVRYVHGNEASSSNREREGSYRMSNRVSNGGHSSGLSSKGRHMVEKRYCDGSCKRASKRGIGDFRAK
jgi:hypothetical protein